jgi:hypothetical protein
MHIVGACQELANEGTIKTEKAIAYFTMSRMASDKAMAEGRIVSRRAYVARP